MLQVHDPMRAARLLLLAARAAGTLRGLGGPGSGNFGHAGRPGEVGGSAPGDGSPQEDLSQSSPAAVQQQLTEDEKKYLTPGEFEKLPPGIRKWKIEKRKADELAAKGKTPPEVKVKEPEVKPEIKVKEPEVKPVGPTLTEREKMISVRQNELTEYSNPDHLNWNDAIKLARQEDEDKYGKQPENSLVNRNKWISDRSYDIAKEQGINYDKARKLAQAEDVAKWGPRVQPEDVAATLASDKTWSLQESVEKRQSGPIPDLPPRPTVDPSEQTPKRDHMIATADRIAKEMNFDPRLINVRDYSGRTFVLNGQTLEEGGHYQPTTGVIELNVHKGINDGTVVHEIQHAQWDYVKSQAGEERNALSSRWSREMADDFRGTRYFTKTGTVRVAMRAEVQKQAPHLMALVDAGLGSRELGIKPSFFEMLKDDGVSSYSKMYWTQAQAKESRPESHVTYFTESAVNETLSELLRRQKTPKEGGDYGFNTFPDRFVKLSKRVQELYSADMGRVRRFFASKSRVYGYP